MKRIRLVLVAGLLAAASASAQDFSKVEVKATELRGGLHLLTGAGGNIVASAGEDGVFLVDDQYAPLNDKIRAALEGISGQPVRFVINTHWHGDHTGGNEPFGQAGAVIVAHDNVRERMSTEQVMAAFGRTVPPSPAAALPVVTFTQSATLHLNGDRAHIIHVPHAHTDGDALVHFPGADVLHMGDTWFNGLYPFIDVGSGGDIDGLVAAVERGVSLAGADTVVVPGHGPVGDRAALAAYGEMLRGFRDRIGELKRAGRSLEEVVAAKPTAAFDETLGGGFIAPERLVGFIYETVD